MAAAEIAAVARTEEEAGEDNRRSSASSNSRARLDSVYGKFELALEFELVLDLFPKSLSRKKSVFLP